MIHNDIEASVIIDTVGSRLIMSIEYVRKCGDTVCVMARLGSWEEAVDTLEELRGSGFKAWIDYDLDKPNIYIRLEPDTVIYLNKVNLDI